MANTYETESAAVWRIDPVHTTVEFEIRHLRVSVVKGRFTGVQGVIAGDLSDPTRATISVAIPSARIDTGYAQRDVHLRSSDFLDTDTYPEITFKSADIEPMGEGSYWVHGRLQIRDVTREITFVGSVDGEGLNYVGEEVVGLTAEARIKPADFGLSWNVPLPGGGMLIGDAARIELHIEAVRQ
jgi:polyisoprenoid-binding protein YceI